MQKLTFWRYIICARPLRELTMSAVPSLIIKGICKSMLQEKTLCSTQIEIIIEELNMIK